MEKVLYLRQLKLCQRWYCDKNLNVKKFLLIKLKLRQISKWVKIKIVAKLKLYTTKSVKKVKF